MGKGITTIESERLILRPLEPEDLDAVHAFFGNAENLEHFPAPFTREEVGKFIGEHGPTARDHGLGFLAVILKSSGQLIGDCGITHQEIDGNMEHEIGYHFHMAHWGNGYATEAARRMKQFGFEELQLDRVCSYMAEDHIPSRRVAERNGMTVDNIYNNPRNRNLPTTVYAISREEWQSKG